ncbi:MAG: hypothetical protein M1819_005933 [Sarea resinae]|nr:MAG: hypothetical protein M1819_005933 [Sarea resinae]
MASLPEGNPPLGEEEYHSSEDEDFNPELAAAHVSDSSDDEDTAPSGKSSKPKKRKPTTAAEDEEIDFENSGDEATIRKGRRKKRKNGNKADEDDEEGGEGGLIKTRAQRAVEEKERKPLVSASGATVDVDALWASMTTKAQPTRSDEAAKSSGKPSKESEAEKEASKENRSAPDDEHSTGGGTNGVGVRKEAAANGEDMITIKRTYDFAGETITEEKVVPRSSAEARLYLQSQQNPPSQSNKPPLRRPKKRASMFEPNPNGVVKGLPPTTAQRGPKLNTIEKSKLDWAGFVDKEGIADELDEASRAKGGYLGRMDFLARSDSKREEELKKAKHK